MTQLLAMNRSEGEHPSQESPPLFDLEGWVEGLARAVVAGVERQTSAQGLTAIEFTLMRVFVENPERTLPQLAEVLPIESGQLTQLVRSLTERGLLGADREEATMGLPVLALTQSGRELVWRLHMRVQAEGSRLLAGVTEAEMATLSSVVSRIVANNAALKRPSS